MMRMSTNAKMITTACLLIFLGALGATDYYLSNRHNLPDSTGTTGSGTVITQNPTGTGSVPTGGVRKQNGPDIASFIQSNGFTTTSTNDLSFLAQVGATDTEIKALAILKDGDRAGSVTWMETAKVKTLFIALKEALLTAFSPQMTDLRDETLQGPSLPVRNYLTFMDPTLSTERLVFVRVRERLYEFHIANGKDDVMNPLIDTLTTK